MNQRTTSRGSSRVSTVSAFTLIELLVVISIIGVLAALIIPLSGVATTKMRISRVKAELNQYVTAIESYKLEVGSYPPDSFSELRTINPARYQQVLTDTNQYKANAAMNSLYYELTGAIFTNSPQARYISVADGETIQATALKTAFNVSGIQNSARNKNDIDYKGFSIRPSQNKEVLINGEEVEILAVPVPGAYQLLDDKKRKINPWFYDASSTNRHNRAGFDLWAEITLKKGETTIIGNWKE